MMSPYLKQYFVSFGVALNMAQITLVLAFTTTLLPQLQTPHSSIHIDDDTGSWIAAIPGFTLLLGNFTIPTIMGKYGRKTAHIFSNIVVFIGWVCMATANSVHAIFVARILQGVSIGMSTSLGPILIAEYTSPKNRGVFLSAISLIMGLGVLIIHTVGLYITWQWTSILCTVISFINFTIIVASPESPSWLATQGRSEDCRKTFHWLRGHDENDELNKMIAACSNQELLSNVCATNSLYNNFVKKMTEFKRSIVKKEFYKPIIIMFHAYVVEEWAGVNIISIYTQYVIEGLIGSENIDVPLLIFTVDIQRVITTALAIYVIKKIKRKTLIIYTTVMSIFIQLAAAGYSYARVSKLLPFESPFVGVILIHLHMFTTALGSLTLPVVISGEIFALKYREWSSAISSMFVSFNIFVNVKTFLYFHNNLGLYGVYILYAGVITYALVVICMLLPETKDKTLQEIEEEFKGRPVRREDVLSAESLMTG